MKFNKEFLIAVFGDNTPAPVVVEPKISEAELHDRYMMVLMSLGLIGIITCFLSIQLGLILVGISTALLLLSKDVNEK